MYAAGIHLKTTMILETLYYFSNELPKRDYAIELSANVKTVTVCLQIIN